MNKQSELIIDFRSVAHGGIIAAKVWKVPVPVPPTTHGYKYRLVYVVRGERIVGFDNERGKGDHCHLDGREVPYRFASIEQLLEDFMAEVEKRARKSWNAV